MKATKKTVSKRQFAEAIIMALTCAKIKYKGTKLAYYCGRWYDLNKQVIENFQKERDKATKAIKDQIDDNQLDHCTVKEDIIQYDKAGNYLFTPEKLKALKKINDPLLEQLNDAEAKFLSDSVEIIVITSPLDSLPEGVEFDIDKALNGFVYNNVSDFHEEVEVI